MWQRHGHIGQQQLYNGLWVGGFSFFSFFIHSFIKSNTEWPASIPKAEQCASHWEYEMNLKTALSDLMELTF